MIFNSGLKSLYDKHYFGNKSKSEMALKGSYTTADALDWQEMLSLVHRLYRDGDYRMSLLISVQCMWGLRIGDVLKLHWNQILNVDELNLLEEKTGKRRIIRMNSVILRGITNHQNRKI